MEPDGKYQNQINYILCSQRIVNKIVDNSQQKQDQELTVAQMVNYFWQNSDLNWRK